MGLISKREVIQAERREKLARHESNIERINQARSERDLRSAKAAEKRFIKAAIGHPTVRHKRNLTWRL